MASHDTRSVSSAGVSQMTSMASMASSLHGGGQHNVSSRGGGDNPHGTSLHHGGHAGSLSRGEGQSSSSSQGPSGGSGGHLNGTEGGIGAMEEPNFLDLHELAKGWKAAIARASDPNTRHEAQVKNDRGNLPLHTAASFRAPIEVTEALLDAYPEAASQTNNYGNLALHFTAWKKGPLDVEKLLLKVYPEGAAQKNNHGNLPLHYAAHYNAPLEVVEALYNAYPEAAMQKNTDSNTPLDLAIADGASPNVVALLQGKKIPPTDEELLDSSKSRCDRLEKELQKCVDEHTVIQEDLSEILSMLMDIKEGHLHALYSTGMDPQSIHSVDSLLDQIHRAIKEEHPHDNAQDESAMNPHHQLPNNNTDEDETQAIEDALLPPDDEVEQILSHIVGLDAVKNQIRGLRRTKEMTKNEHDQTTQIPHHVSLVGNPGTGKTFVARCLMPLLYKIGVVKKEVFLEVGRDDLIDRKSEARTVEKTRKLIAKATGGVLFVDEAYTLLPSPARRRGRDHGAAALKELAKILPAGDPLVIVAGYPTDLQLVLASDTGFKGHFLLQFDCHDLACTDLAKITFAKMQRKGFVPGDGVTIGYLADMIRNQTDPDWRMERNGHVCDLLVHAVRTEIKRRIMGGDDTASRASVSPYRGITAPGSNMVPLFPPEEVLVTVEDFQNVFMSGL
eukprot:CAMPEP_0172509352 /NCGR_PEP_ID=MMETSP1066-20121228/219700_1 /TAXON_ID=671091 /ORGANISM="Coscinodiscus wailesii, Strain CCMP2513" /LENGTH=672 /DNA_ID=CAMNT_0013287793 /DNA_START=316 /DNA_END=2334 /DNA_ORIENTATION=+